MTNSSVLYMETFGFYLFPILNQRLSDQYCSSRYLLTKLWFKVLKKSKPIVQTSIWTIWFPNSWQQWPNGWASRRDFSG